MPENDAVVFEDVETVEIEERSVPEPDDDEVLVETTRTLISTGTELATLTGDHRPGETPLVHGYCNVGEVVEVGDAVDGEWLGRRVTELGNHQAYVTVPVEQCVAIPDRISDDAAAFATMAQIAMNGVRRGRVEWGETVAVYGVGLVGQMALRFCHLAGAQPAIGFEIAASRLAHVPERPGVAAADPTEEDPAAFVGELTDGRLADVVIEATANVDAIPREFDILREQGRMVVLSSPREAGEFDYYADCHRPSYEIIGAHGSSHPSVETAANPWTAARHRELFLELIDANRIEVESLITHRGSYRDAPDLYQMLLEDRTRALGVVMEW